MVVNSYVNGRFGIGPVGVALRRRNGRARDEEVETKIGVVSFDRRRAVLQRGNMEWSSHSEEWNDERLVPLVDVDFAVSDFPLDWEKRAALWVTHCLQYITQPSLSYRLLSILNPKLVL